MTIDRIAPVGKESKAPAGRERHLEEEFMAMTIERMALVGRESRIPAERERRHLEEESMVIVVDPVGREIRGYCRKRRTLEEESMAMSTVRTALRERGDEGGERESH